MRLSIYVVDELGEKLRNEAAEKGVKLSHLVGETITSYYNRPTNDQAGLTPHEKKLYDVQLEAKDRDIARLEDELNWLRGVYSVAVSKLPETTEVRERRSIWDIFRKKKHTGKPQEST